MPALLERTILTRPFMHDGQDFAGLFEIKSYVERGCRVTKGYVLVLVCFAKAIYLKATSEISTDCFLSDFTRWTSRRGCPPHIYSDNKTGLLALLIL